MTLLGKALFGLSTVAAAGAATATWVALNGQTGGGQAAPSGQRPSGDNVVICVAAGSVMMAASGGSCPPGETPLNLDCAGCAASGAQDAEHLNEELADLQRRLNALRRSSLFTVLDKEGRPIFGVSEDRATVYNATSGAPPSSIRRRVPDERPYLPAEAASFGGDGGVFTARAPDGRLVTRLGVPNHQPRVWIEEGGVTRMEMGKNAPGSLGRYSFKVNAPATPGGAVAGIGESPAGTGVMIVGDAAGKTKASMLIADGLGMFGVSNAKGTPVVALTQGATGGGLLTIGDANRTPMVKMGVKDDRYGVVLAGPQSGFPFVPRSGLPGSYFLGCAAGPSCRP